MCIEQTEKISKKIKKLLALAGNNPNEQEAEEAMLKAQELMAQYDIEMKDAEGVDISNDGPVEIGRTDHTLAAYYKLRLAHVIADNFKVMVFTTKTGHGKVSRISFYGYRSDVATAIALFNFVLGVMEYNWWHRYYGKVKGNKKEYSMGFVNGLDKRFKEQVSKNGWGLIVCTPKAVQEAADKFKKVNRVSAAQMECSDAYLFGTTDGYVFDHNKKEIKG